MKQPILAILLIAFLSLTCYSQSANILKFVPQGYSILELKKGDLNLDSIEDAVLVLDKNGEDSTSTIKNPVKRNLLILIGQPNGIYMLDTQNENAVYYYGFDANFKDAFVGVRIEKGRFTIEHYGGFSKRWGRTTTFEFNPSANDWLLLEDEYSVMDATDQDEPNKVISETKLTNKNFGAIPFGKFNIYEGFEIVPTKLYQKGKR
ncbi:MAG TPA: hypothetical protein PLH91_05120 [Tenuifilaceae bacterium]|nr:hypothetical protein [Tenuifilaceae bacterium]HPI44589.1 hypothetical protein [Tenuifilaceae bacterium]HPN21078.1 hypothetical protein [Tenuifilaceae bacterium]